MSYRDSNGIEHESYSDACRYYGADTPGQLEAAAKLARQQYEESAAAQAYEIRLRVRQQLWAAELSGAIEQLEAVSDEALLEYQTNGVTVSEIADQLDDAAHDAHMAAQKRLWAGG